MPDARARFSGRALGFLSPVSCSRRCHTRVSKGPVGKYSREPRRLCTGMRFSCRAWNSCCWLYSIKMCLGFFSSFFSIAVGVKIDTD